MELGLKTAGKVLAIAAGVAGGLAVALVVTCVLVEGTLFHTSGRYMDPEYGLTHAPGIHVSGIEGFAWSRMAEHGIRIPLRGSRSIEGSHVLCLGDSFTEGFQLPYDETWPAVLERLAGSAGKRTTCINAGASGGSPAKYIAAAGAYSREFKPDLVVIQVTDSDFDSDLFNATYPFFLVRTGGDFRVGEGAWALDPGLRAKEAAVRSRITFGDGVRWMFTDVTAKRSQPVRPMRQTPKPPRVMAAETAHRPAQAPSTPGTETAHLADWLVGALDDAYACPVVIAYLPTLAYPDVSTNPSQWEVALQDATAGHSVTFVSLRRSYVERFLADGVPSNGFDNTQPGIGHINRTGHELLAEALLPSVVGRR